jgi:hypothetical protein
MEASEMAGKKHKSRPIVIGHLEKISSRMFERYPEQITGLVKQGQGVYALYRRDKLYYIGLASDLERRIKWHLKDKHTGKWDRFNLYMIKKTDHIREVESLLIRIAEPEGNKLRGKLGGSKNLGRDLKAAVKWRQNEERETFFGQQKGSVKKGKKGKITGKSNRPMKGYFPSGKMIYVNYKGKDYRAWVYGGGTIKLIPSGELFNSPSLAGIAVTKKKTMNGWRFWRYKDKNGELVYIDQLRKMRG